MKKKNSLILDEEFIAYCELNKIQDIDKLAKETFNRGFTILKYGETPFKISATEKIVEKEVIKEIPVEKIVEVIKEVTVTAEPKVLIQEVVKEVVVENNTEISRLKEENDKLRNEIEMMNTTLDKFNKAKYLRSSDLSNLYGE
jgi:hypothetical protein